MIDSKNLKTTIAVHAKYQAFRLAEGLDRLGFLNELYTVYPKFKIGPYDITRAKIRSNLLLGGLRYLSSRFGFDVSDLAVSLIFDNWVARHLKKPSGNWVFHGWSGFSKESLMRAKKIGGLAIVDRACPHIDFQQELLAEEKTLLLKRHFQPEAKPLYQKMREEYEIADFIIVPSTYAQRGFLAKGIDAQKIIILPICNEKLTRPPHIMKGKNKFSVLCVGGTFFRKGMYYLLKAWEALALPDAELIIKGTIPKEFSELLIIKNVRFITGYMSDDEIAGLYDEASIFVLPSIDDGFGMVVIEAMAAGLPVIVTENVGASDCIEDCKDGFVVPIRSIEALKEKIKFFYDNPDKIKIIGEAAIKKADEYSPATYANRAVEIYRQLVAGS